MNVRFLFFDRPGLFNRAFVDMIVDNDPPITRNISVPRDMSQLSCSSFTAGIVEAVLDGLGFVRDYINLKTGFLTRKCSPPESPPTTHPVMHIPGGQRY